MRKVLVLSIAVLAFAVTGWAQQYLQITNGPNVQWDENGKAQIAWSTNAPSAGQDLVRYGTNPNMLNQVASARQDRRERNGDFNHMAQLVNLQPGATYYFQIQSNGSQGVLTSQIGSFQANGSTQAVYPYNQNGQGSYTSNQAGYNPYGGGNDNGALRINNGPNVEKTGDTTATIAWSTNMPGQSLVRYGTNPSDLDKTLNDQVSQNAPEANGSYNHRIMISGLRPHTTYYFVVETNGVRSAPQQFRTE